LSSTREAAQHFLLLEKFAVPSVSTLNFVAHLVVTYTVSHKAIQNHSIFFGQTLDPKKLLKTVQEIRYFIDPNGSLNFDKHPALRAQNEKINNLSRQIRDRIHSLIKDDLYRESLAYDQYDIFDDRFVLPIRSDHYRYEHGIIISRSQSGQTLLVEPLELRELSNKRLRELSVLDEIINNLCFNLGKSISSAFQDYFQIFQTIQNLDLLICKTLFTINKKLCKPEINDSNDFDIHDFFHPLIENPVRNSISIKSSMRGLVISGPNTGGKTVTLKSLCLCFMFYRLGLYVPAASASLPNFSNVYFFSHDQQSLEKGLSSFSSESERYLSIIDDLKDNSFVFIDEIFNSTSSEEASALALGFIDYISSKASTKLMISSHHHRLKAIVHQNGDFISAHVGFDQATERPTYKLHVGSPGPSMAITVFKNFSKRFTHSIDIAKLAEAYLEKSYINYEHLLEDLNSQKELLETKNLDLNLLIKQTEQAKNAAQGILNLEKERLLKDFETELLKKIRIADELILKLKHNPTSSAKSYYTELKEVKASLPSNQSSKESKALTAPIDYSSIKLNDYYYHSELSQNVLVLEVNSRKKLFLVLAGKIKIWTEAIYLHQPQKAHTNKNFSNPVFTTRESTSSLSLDARGSRLDEFQRMIDQAISDLFCDDLPYIEIIHGHGEGTLKKWLRDHLNSQNDIEWTTPDGNDGSTIIKIK
jgi:DNA mismatch repair protein MutS2